MTAPTVQPDAIRLNDQAAALDALDAEAAAVAQALAAAEAGRAERETAVAADEAALTAARRVLWEVARVGNGRDVVGPNGPQHLPESEAAARQRTLDQRDAAVAVETAERAAGASRRAWVAGERRRSDLLAAAARLTQRRHQLEHDEARRAAAAPTTGDGLRALARRLGLGG